MTKMGTSIACLCDGTDFRTVFTYTKPPECEVRYSFNRSEEYQREVRQCRRCGHLVTVHDMDLTELYEHDYVESTYGGKDGIRRAFDRVTSLDPAASDNVGRAARVHEYAERHLPQRAGVSPSVLDVGSGLCVFPHRMKALGWDCTALDLDPRSIEHAREVVGVKGFCGDLGSAQELGQFDVVTLNRVLEHVENPVVMLSETRQFLLPGGFVYVEVPDGELAALEGPEREEFGIDHWHIFSAESLAHLVTASGFVLQTLERMREPSQKFTLRAFIVLPQDGTVLRNE